MDFALHHLRERPVDETLRRHPALAGKTLGDDTDAKMTGAPRRAGVTGVEGAVVDNLDVARGELLSKLRLDPRHAIAHASAPGGRRRLATSPSSSVHHEVATSTGISTTLAAAALGSAISRTPSR